MTVMPYPDDILFIIEEGGRDEALTTCRGTVRDL